MTIINIKRKTVADLPSLTRLVLQFIYDQDNMRLEAIHLMQDSLIGWSEKLALDKRMNEGIIGYEAVYAEQLQWLGMMLDKNDRHQFDERKRMFRIHKIDYKKFHQLPGANTEKDLYLAQQVYKAYAAKNPEQEQTKSDKPKE